MKNLRKKLMAAIAMLCVSAVMLTGVSYAWFTLSTNPEVSGVKANISANDNLEIALDNGYASGTDVDDASKDTNNAPNGKINTGNPYTWGNLVSLDTAFSNEYVKKLTLKPVQYTATGTTVTFNYPQYGADGRIGTFKKLSAYAISDHSSATYAATDSTIKSVNLYGEDNTLAGNKTFDAVSVTYWLRSNETSDVNLTADGVLRAKSSEDASPSEGDVNAVKGNGSYITFPSTNNAADVYNLVNNYLRIRFDVIKDGQITSYYARTTATAAASATDSVYKYPLQLYTTATGDKAAANISLTADEAQKVVMYVYLDGETISNADALTTDLTDMQLNVQFAATNILDAMDSGTVYTPSSN
jgi:hypothetical protein